MVSRSPERCDRHRPGRSASGRRRHRDRRGNASSYAYSKENLTDAPDTYAAAGALEFWSSGGLIQSVPADTPLLDYESYSLTPKHIRVIMLADDQVAIAQFYVEGSYLEVDQAPTTDYMTRVTQVFVEEDGQWKVRASHFSPITGGSGTSQRAP